jgi:hypothetical protein
MPKKSPDPVDKHIGARVHSPNYLEHEPDHTGRRGGSIVPAAAEIRKRAESRCEPAAAYLACAAGTHRVPLRWSAAYGRQSYNVRRPRQVGGVRCDDFPEIQPGPWGLKRIDSHGHHDFDYWTCCFQWPPVATYRQWQRVANSAPEAREVAGLRLSRRTAGGRWSAGRWG